MLLANAEIERAAGPRGAHDRLGDRAVPRLAEQVAEHFAVHDHVDADERCAADRAHFETVFFPCGHVAPDRVAVERRVHQQAGTVRRVGPPRAQASRTPSRVRSSLRMAARPPLEPARWREARLTVVPVAAADEAELVAARQRVAHRIALAHPAHGDRCIEGPRCSRVPRRSRSGARAPGRAGSSSPWRRARRRSDARR